MSVGAVKEEMLHIDRSGRSMPVYIAGPERSGQFPAVIIVHEIFGLNDHIKHVARRFAAESVVAYAPDLFANYALEPANRDDLNAMRALWQTIPDSHLISDLQEVMHLAELNPAVLSEQIGTMGFCMGGAIAFMFACSTPRIRWVADFYGRIKYPQLSEEKPKHPIDYIDSLNCAVLGVFAGQDELITAEHIDNFQARLAKSGQLVSVNVYENARHAFFNDEREFYDKAAAGDAWVTTLKFMSAANRKAKAYK